MCDIPEILGQRDHIYRFSDTYIGSCDEFFRRDLIFKDNRLQSADICLSQGELRCYEEIISNAADNIIRSRIRGDAPPHTTMHVYTFSDHIRVRNGGPAISTHLHPSEPCHIPELIFGRLLTSTNYSNDMRHTAGKNGYGGKLNNIFSKKFIIRVNNVEEHVLYTQEWGDNMRICIPPTFAPSQGVESWTEVEYYTDFARFKRSKHLDVDVDLFSRVAFDYTLSCRMDVWINGSMYEKITAGAYARQLTAAPLSEWTSLTVTSAGVPLLEFAVGALQGGGCYSFVNGIRTIDGGVHTDAVWKRILPVIMAEWPGVSSHEIRGNVLLVVSASLPGPIFKSQTKDFLAAPKPKIPAINRQDILALLQDTTLRETLTVRLKRSDIKPQTVEGDGVLMEGFIDANNAGTGSDCVLMVVEGRSARCYAEELIKYLPGGRNKFGILECRGKTINAFDSDSTRVKKNSDVRRLVQAAGIDSSGMCRRYCHLWILADADVDGGHIVLLILCILFNHAIEMLRKRCVFVYNSPIIRAKMGDHTQSFYTIGDYKKWAGNASRHGVRWMKGLGTSNSTDILQDYRSLNITAVVLDQDAAQSIQRVFSRVSSGDRKQMLQFDPGEMCVAPESSVTDFMRYNSYQYAVTANLRSLPAVDGLKRPQRQIIWAACTKWSTNNNPDRGLVKERRNMKVEQLAGYISDTLNYHYGERSLSKGIIHLASKRHNNYPLLVPDGQFDTLDHGIAGAASSRYIFTTIDPWLSLLFPPVDMHLTHKAVEEGVEVEPTLMLPVIPYSVINGVRGMGVGYRCQIAPYHIYEVIDWFLSKLEGGRLKTPRPWIKNNKGSVHVRSKKGGYRGDEDDDDCEIGAQTWMETEGAWEIVRCSTHKVDIHVSSLPYGTTPAVFMTHMEVLTQRGVLARATNVSRENISIDIKGILLKSGVKGSNLNTDHFPRSISDIPGVLKLKKNFSLCHINTVQADGRVRNFNSIDSLLEDFYAFRLPFYSLRGKHIVDSLEKELQNISAEHRFITAVCDGTIKIIDTPEKLILDQLTAIEVPHSVYRTTKAPAINADGIHAINLKLKHLNEQLFEEKTITPEQRWIADLSRLKNNTSVV